MKQAWKFLSGKKTYIGAAIGAFGYYGGNIAGFWDFNPFWLKPLLESIALVSAALLGVGGYHAKIKAANGNGKATLKK